MPVTHPIFAAMSAFRSHCPYIIAGPCSAETRDQVLETGRELRALDVALFRAGVWKPRTKPGSFEGNGEQALGWLKEMKQETGLSFSVEVAETEHVELALQYGADVLWIGARTTVNPFQVQRLADALSGVPVPVMVKNPVHPDVDLWEGALQRFERAGIPEVVAIHRGFYSYHSSSSYRNPPNWIIPIELRRRRPDMFMICDPSHIAGARWLVPIVAQKALDLGFQGLMLETHPRPEEAWSDAEQQLTPAALKELISSLVVRRQFTADMDKSNELEYLRQLMDSVDAEIIDLLARRMKLSERMGLVKKDCNMAVYSPERWREIVDTRTERAKMLEMRPEYILALWELIHDESIKKQLVVFDNSEKINLDPE